MAEINLGTPDGINELYAAIGEYVDGIAQDIIDAAVPPVDTGFLEGSAYVLSSRMNTFDQTWESGRYMSTKGRGIQSRSRAPYPVVGADNVTIVGWAAIYAWWIEDNMPFIYPALLSVAEGE